MKYFVTAALLTSAISVLACGRADEGSETSDIQGAQTAKALIHKIQPLNVTSSCFGSVERIIRDHRVTPPRTYSQYVLSMKDCSPPASSLVIQMLGGQQWTGGYSFVTIKKNGLCLTNSVTYAPNGTDKGESLWQSCVAQDSSSVERYRQQWLLIFNNYNALQIQTHAAVRLGHPNAQIQCLDRQDPTTLKRVACSLHNWQVRQAS